MADALAKEKIVLYGLLRGDFTAAKAARSKELRKEDLDLANAVAALPKPSVASEALNALARDDPSEVRALVQSGKRLRTAQEAAVAGKRGKALSAALDKHRAALERVQRSLGSLELSGPTLERANRTLRADPFCASPLAVRCSVGQIAVARVRVVELVAPPVPLLE